MSKKNNGVNYGKLAPQQRRRRSALNMLTNQLDRGNKVNKDGLTVDLTEKDVKRINKEIGSLKEKLK